MVCRFGLLKYCFIVVITPILLFGCNGGSEDSKTSISFSSSDPRFNFLQEKKYAIVVGVGDYSKSSGFRKLKYSENDALEIQKELKKRGYEVILLTNDEAGKFFILRALDKVKSAFTKNNGTLLFTFSGHGYSDKDTNYLATKGTTAYNLSESGVSLNEIKKLMNESGARKRMMFIDACRDNPFPSKSITSKGFVSDSDSEGINILYSTKNGKVSYEMSKLKHSVFSYYLIEGLKTAERDQGILTFTRLADYITKNVKKESITTNYTDIQIPYRSSVSTGKFIVSIDEKYKPNKAEIRNIKLNTKKNPVSEKIVNKKIKKDKYFVIQVAAVKNRNNANRVLNDLIKGGFTAYIEPKRGLNFVMVGNFDTRSSASLTQKKMLSYFPNGRNVKASIIKYIKN